MAAEESKKENNSTNSCAGCGCLLIIIAIGLVLFTYFFTQREFTNTLTGETVYVQNQALSKNVIYAGIMFAIGIVGLVIGGIAENAKKDKESQQADSSE